MAASLALRVVASLPATALRTGRSAAEAASESPRSVNSERWESRVDDVPGKAVSERDAEVDAGLGVAVQAALEAVTAAPPGHPDRGVVLNNLCYAPLRLFLRTGKLAVLARAVAAGREAVALIPGDHDGRITALSNFGSVLRFLFERTGEAAAVAEAVVIAREIVVSTPDDHPMRAARLGDLGVVLLMQFERTPHAPLALPHCS
jgi:hypothetical protein